MITNQLEPSIIKGWFEYCPKTGKLFWKRSPSHFIHVGDEAGSIHRNRGDKTFYCRVGFNNKVYQAHVLIWIMHYGNIPDGFEPDHIDHNGINNCLDNLRLVTHSDNQQNISMHKNNTSGITGVCYHKYHRKWLSNIRVDKKLIHLGYFVDIADAVTIRKKAEIKYNFHRNHGESL